MGNNGKPIFNARDFLGLNSQSSSIPETSQNPSPQKTLNKGEIVSDDEADFTEAVLNKDLRQKKYNRDYLIQFVRTDDNGIISLMNAGSDGTVSNGDTIRLKANFSFIYNQDPWLQNKINEAIKTRRYQTLPFYADIAEDIRAKYILRTNADDDFDSIFKEIESLWPQYGTQEDWQILKSLIFASIKRLHSTDVFFLNPIIGGSIGTFRKLTPEEAEKYNVTDNTFVDERKDDHDLISLKELVWVMKGNKIDLLSPFAGSFSKYLPELNEAGIRSIIFHVKDSKLVKIVLDRYEQDERVPFGPVEASNSLSKYIKQSGEDLTPQDRFYVCVNGFITCPKNLGEYGFTTLLIKNNKIAPSAETFLFQNLNQGIITTRLYFYPHNPMDLHPLVQTMSVVYGISDQTYTSCAYDPERKWHSQEHMTQMASLIKSFAYDQEPGVKASHRLYLDYEQPPESICLIPKYEALGVDCSDSIIGENRFTIAKYLNKKQLPTADYKTFELIKTHKLLGNCMALFSRFLFADYVAGNNSGLTKEAQPTTFRLIKSYDFNEVMEDFRLGVEMVQGLRKAQEAIEQGMDSEEAFNQFAKEHIDKMNEFKDKSDKGL